MHLPTRPDLNDIERRMELSRQRAAKRRKLLVEAGFSTYILSTRNGMNVILCLCCGMTSANKNDIEQRYCGFCRAHHSEWISEEGV
jgi:hypothetical protein